MPLEILTIPCLTDNYAFLAHDPQSGETMLVDAPEAEPILEALAARNWTLDQILLTHHHPDHVQGVDAILKVHDAKVIGASADSHRLPDLDISVSEGDTVQIGGETGHVIDVSGHTVGHIAFHFPESKAVFTADSLMALGCGRLFEGTPEQMWTSLSKIASLPADTVVYSGHEYTQANGRFAVTVDPENPQLAKRIADISKARDAGTPTVPSELSLELATNPFLRAENADVQKAIGMEGAAAVDVFTEIRARKDRF